MFSVSEVLSMCYNSNFGLSGDESTMMKEKRSTPTEGQELAPEE